MQTEYQIIEKSRSKKVTVPLITMPKSQYNANYGVIALDTPPTALMNQWEAKFFQVDQNVALLFIDGCLDGTIVICFSTN